ncbi:MAG: hypothetical protein J6W96_02075 [Alphaproteobacteria bacterium]|nr:hypothetical protein [Alphaproteobacteria bacterium]
MKKYIKILSVLICGCVALASTSVFAADTATQKEPSTRNNAVIFKVHEIDPVMKDGVVTGCDFSVTLYNRTSINFRSFTLNLEWNDVVDERFRFDNYMAAYLDAEEYSKQKEFIGSDAGAVSLQTSIAISAFGADKQISIRSHVDSEKCYLMLGNASYRVSPCDIVRNIDNMNAVGINNKECSQLFQFVNTSNPEYFGQFKKLSATEIVAQQDATITNDLADIDVVIKKIVENLGSSDTALAEIN